MLDNTLLNKEWFELQEKLWGSEGGVNHAFDVSLNDWLETTDAFWKTHFKDAPIETYSLYQKLHNCIQLYCAICKPVFSSNNQQTNPESLLTQYLHTYIKSVEKDLQHKTNTTLSGLLDTNYKLWQQQLGTVIDIPEGFPEFLKSAHTHAFADEAFEKVCDNTLEAFINYQTAYLNMTLDASREMLILLKDTESSDISINDLLTSAIEVFEKHSAAFITHIDYPRLFADLINNWMLLIQQIERFIQPWQNIMPNSIQKRAKHAD